MSKVTLLGVPIDSVLMQEALERIERLIEARWPSYVVTPNVDVLVKLQTDAEFRRIYDDASLVVADGMFLIWAAKFLGMPLKEKVSGSDLFVEFCELAARKGYKIYLLGAMPGVAPKAAAILMKRYAGLNIVGTYSPPFGFEEDEAECERIVRMIRDAAPDVLFIGLGSPKQEKWLVRHKHRYGTPVSIGVGISFDYVAGTVKRAPRWMQNAGFEWFWRLLMEPKRLWRRYLVEDLVFFWLVAKQKMQKDR
jgi:N-acetylglucosaminyldiphosphoundecaprenol N-acetyl-beta-D-mannosaminyltransferase